MSKIIEKILADLYEIDPALKEKEEELKKIIEKLLSSKPDATIDERFRTELRDKIISNISGKRSGFMRWIFSNKLKITIAAAAGIFSAVLAFSILLPVIISLNQGGSKKISFSNDKTEETIQQGRDDGVIIAETKTEDESPPVPEVTKSKKTRQKDTVVTREKDKMKDAEKDESVDKIEATEELEKGSRGDEYDELMENVLSEEKYEEDYDEASGSVAESEPAAPDLSITWYSRSKEDEGEALETDWNTEEYDRIYENRFLKTSKNPLSTFSIDVDTASYANVRRFLKNNQMPYKDAVRIEELINYFPYDYPEPSGTHPFAFFTEISTCPWNTENKLFHIGIQGKNIPADQLPPDNLVFLLDVSGSMNDDNKLPLLKQAFTLLVGEMREKDSVAIVVYAGAAGLVLPSTPGNEKATILGSLDQLSAGGSTAGGAGIQLAYETAKKHYDPQGNNRIILATDGDFNIGPSSDAELIRLIEKNRDQGIFLTILGFGMGNYKDSKMEKLADKGNGNYAYIDTLKEANKVLVRELGGTLFTIAKDVKIQIEFNPVHIDSYRLIGYENRVLAKEDFTDDTKDAGELGAGHTVTALYEIIPSTGEKTDSDALKYQENRLTEDAYISSEIMTLKFRYKKPDEDTSIPIEIPVIDKHIPLSASTDNFRFSAAVAEWGLLLRDSEYKNNATYEQVLDLAKGALGTDEYGYRAEFIELVKISRKLAGDD